jgi:hypothetical protein
MSYAVTLNHVRYGRMKFDLAELKRRIEARLAAGISASKLARLLIQTERLMALMDVAETGRNSKELQSRLNAEFALLLLNFDLVQSVMAGKSDQRRRPARPQRALPAPKRKLPR